MTNLEPRRATFFDVKYSLEDLDEVAMASVTSVKSETIGGEIYTLVFTIKTLSGALVIERQNILMKSKIWRT